MDIGERIARRQAATRTAGIIVERRALNPAAHVENPVGRGPMLERLLDLLDPLFSDRLPPNVHVHGPGGTGKSAIVSGLFGHLSRQLTSPQRTIQTTTRGTSQRGFEFVRVDSRRAASPFRLYHAVLDALTDEPVPRRGVGTDALRDQLAEALSTPGRAAVVAVDHVGEPNTISRAEVGRLFEPVSASLSWLTVGREIDADEHAQASALSVPAYRTHELVDILTERASQGLRQGTFDHAQARRIAEWADGDAHDALAALFGAASLAERNAVSRVREPDVTAAMEAVPDGCVPLGRVLALPPNRQAALAALLDLEDAETASVEVAANTIAAESDLSAGTVKRYLYELAESGILQRVANDQSVGSGRQPSRVVPQFPTLAFRELYEE